MSQSSKLAMIQDLLNSADTNIRSAKNIIAELTGSKGSEKSFAKMAESLPSHEAEGDEKIVEGIFSGESMTDNTGKTYPVPANYASKSKLIPGDTLKLTIKEDGSFLYKQIGPIPRKRVIGTLTYEDGQYRVIAEGKAYRVLLASVTYFKGEVGDQVTLIVAEDDNGEWGAIENIIPSSQEDLSFE